MSVLATRPLARLDALPPEVTENIASFLEDEEHDSGLRDFRALRLTCKDLYLKTFRLFGVTHFSDISVAFTVTSLRRLRCIANHTNVFGQSLRNFPRELSCSTYRLPSGDEVRSLLRRAAHFATRAETNAVIEAIALACKIGIEQAIIVGPYNSRIQAIVHQYREAFVEQQSIESSGYDVRSLGDSMSALPNLNNVTCFVGNESWGQIDWSTTAGLDKASFSSVEYQVNGKSNLTIATAKILRAVGRAISLLHSKGRHIRLDQLELCGPGVQENYQPVNCPQNIALHRIDISSHTWDSLYRLRTLSIAVSPCEQTEEIAQKTKATLRSLLCSRVIENLLLLLHDRIDPMDSTMTTTSENVDCLLGMFIEAQHCTRLRTLNIFSPGIYLRMEGMMGIIGKNAGTLEELVFCTEREVAHQLLGADDSRESWKPLLQTASGCTKLMHFMLIVSAKGSQHDIHINVEGKEMVSAVLAKLVVSPTNPAKELGWIM